MTTNGDAMADGDIEPEPGETGETGADAATCLACRGTGQVTSGLGGEPHSVVCPWCRGTGQRIAGIDAQENPSETGSPAPPES